MDRSIFTDKNRKPSEPDLKEALGEAFFLWQLIRESSCNEYKEAIEEWNYPGEKYGWSFRIKDKKRVLIYLLPRDKYFKVAFVFGQKAMDKIMASDIDPFIIEALQAAKVYAEGRGIRIDIRDKKNLEDIRKLISIKIKN